MFKKINNYNTQFIPSMMIIVQESLNQNDQIQLGMLH
jgi:hypothetical protein